MKLTKGQIISRVTEALNAYTKGELLVERKKVGSKEYKTKVYETDKEIVIIISLRPGQE